MRQLYQALKSFNGIGLLVSHDRELLDSLCHQCLFIEPPDAVLRLNGRLNKAKDELNRIKIKKEYEMGIWVSYASLNKITILYYFILKIFS